MYTLTRRNMAIIWRKFIKLKYILFLPLLLMVVYFEWLCYYEAYFFRWPNINCDLVEDVHKILLVADPQILGENSELFIAQTDSDRFLKYSFDKALNYVKPDLIIFLGDLMDEGSMSSDEQYERYYARFRNIFQLDYIPENKTIFIPGDNDIGGEDEDVTEFKVNRFKKHFPSNTDVVTIKNMKFFKINSMVRTFPDVNVDNDDFLRILISHVPLLGVHSTFGEQAITQLKPLFIFSAHDHKSVHLATGRHTAVREYVDTLEKTENFFGLNDTARVNEIVVPTSSYRMGTRRTGYGVAHLSVKGDALCYYILWSPDRLGHLLIYLLAVIFYTIGILFFSARLFYNVKPKIYKFTKLSV